ncbi:MAG TPA: hypothetical protein VKB71_14545, partial [Rhizomicrobium sp.]|nr:hypothetical protein [Rhizomicrobium sp.]
PRLHPQNGMEQNMNIEARIVKLPGLGKAPESQQKRAKKWVPDSNVFKYLRTGNAKRWCTAANALAAVSPSGICDLRNTKRWSGVRHFRHVRPHGQPHHPGSFSALRPV